MPHDATCQSRWLIYLPICIINLYSSRSRLLFWSAPAPDKMLQLCSGFGSGQNAPAQHPCYASLNKSHSDFPVSITTAMYWSRLRRRVRTQASAVRHRRLGPRCTTYLHKKIPLSVYFSKRDKHFFKNGNHKKH